jgi:mutator protein MutT
MINKKKVNLKEIKGSTFILQRKDKKMLMQLRDSKSEHYPNMWCFPGGRGENGEKIEDTVARETKEEFDIDLKLENCELITKYILPYAPIVDYVFLCKLSEDQKPKLKEGAGMKWMNIEDIQKIKLGFGQEVIISYLEKYLKT